MADISTLWTFSAQSITRERQRRSQKQNLDPTDPAALDADPSEDALGEFADEETQPEVRANGSQTLVHAAALAEQAEDRRWLRSTNVVARAGSTQQTAELRTQQRIAQEAKCAARGQHLPWRGDVAEDARILRTLKGIQPLGSVADADQLSDWEDALENAKIQRVRYGEKDIVQIGRRRTLAEEEHSHHEDDMHAQTAPPGPDLSLPHDLYGMGDVLLEDTSGWSESMSASFDLPRTRPRRSLPQRWTPQRTAGASAAAAALDAIARQSMAMTSPIAEDEDLDADIEDMD